MYALAETLELQAADQTGRNQRPVFLSVDIIDTSADGFRNEALLYADLLRSDSDENWRRINMQALDDAVKGVDARIIEGYRTLILKFPSALCEQLYSDVDLVVDDYSTDEVNNSQVVKIPMENVTGHRSLSYPSSTNDYHPKLNLRVQTSFDKPVLSYGDSREIIETPNPGRWISLPFEMVEIATII